ncbi:MAG: PfkB family carbohydrate kinase [Candidatus ainarchaeum sp.]|nr:PfkB family carbohydrate kinase [Candidatus ainarchaeum sp.]
METPGLVVVGSMALDDIRTPFGEVKKTLGGAATYAGIAASIFTKVGVIAVVGKDFPEEHIRFLNGKGIDTRGVKFAEGRTFRWSAYYEYDMAQAHTLKTELNVFSGFSPEVPDGFSGAGHVFLANIDPKLQMHVLGQMRDARFTALDTMNFWIGRSRQRLTEAIGKVDAVFINDAELRQLCGTHSLVKAAKHVLRMGPEFVVVKKGEHGALLFSAEGAFSAPAFPLEDVIDPTGAGDSFAGAAMGWLAKSGGADEKQVRKAVIYGTAVASFNAEHFGAGKLRGLTIEEVEERVRRLAELSRFE